MTEHFDRPTVYVENIQLGRFDGELGIRFLVNGALTEGFRIAPDLLELLRDEINAILTP